MNHKIENTLSRLKAGSISEKVTALQQFASAFKIIFAEAIKAFTTESDEDCSFLIAERLVEFGNIITEEIEEALNNPRLQDQHRILLGITLAFASSKIGTDIARCCVSEGPEDYIPLAARALIKTNVDEIGNLIGNRITSISSPNVIEALLVLLLDSGKPLPSKVVETLKMKNMSWSINEYLKKIRVC